MLHFCWIPEHQHWCEDSRTLISEALDLLEAAAFQLNIPELYYIFFIIILELYSTFSEALV